MALGALQTEQDLEAFIRRLLDRLGLRPSVAAGPAKAAKVWRSTTLPLGAGVAQYVSWDTVVYDNDGMFSSGSPDRLTIRTPGLYTIVCHFEASAGGLDCQQGIVLNGSNFLALNTVTHEGVCAAQHNLAAGDVLQYRLYNRGGAGTLSASEPRSNGISVIRGGSLT